ncbi:MAG: tyrosine-protein phosphatase, partial [Clostridia bacterium]|nr:tyrosine-protein phosphatase [Clostridia bacterium]
MILAAGCDDGNPPESPSDIPAGPSLTITEMPEEVILIHPSAQKFLNAGDDVQAEDLRKTLGDKDRWDVSIPAVVEFRVDGLVAPQLITSCTAKFWKDGEPEKAKTLEVQNYANEVRLYNLERGEQYRVSLTVLLSDGVELYDEIGFRTADLPRILTVDGISNFRDFGGWKTADGSRIRQGLLYRGTELDGAVNSKYNLTSAGVAQMEEEFGIRAVLDLRYTKNYEIVERLGPNVRYHYYSVSSYVGIFANKHKVTTPYVFRVLADPDNYPLYIHCTHGMDRTGT